MGMGLPTVLSSRLSQLWVRSLVLAHRGILHTRTTVSRVFTGGLYSTGEPYIFYFCCSFQLLISVFASCHIVTQPNNINCTAAHFHSSSSPFQLQGKS